LQERVRTWRGELGQSLVEFSLVLPIMLLLLFALVDFGRAFHTWLVVTNSAREGARAASVQKPEADIRARINQTAGSLDTSKLTIQLTNVQGPRGTTVEVDLTYAFQYVTPIGGILNFVSGGNLATPTIGNSTSMRLE
jgi:Flp pilus assembly protein TadG